MSRLHVRSNGGPQLNHTPPVGSGRRSSFDLLGAPVVVTKREKSMFDIGTEPIGYIGDDAKKHGLGDEYEELFNRVPQPSELDRLAFGERLHNAKHTDPNTGFYKELYGLEYATPAQIVRALEQHERAYEGQDVTVTVRACDIDGLSVINNLYDHSVGDGLLRAFASLFRCTDHGTVERRQGIAFGDRPHGDEFKVAHAGTLGEDVDDRVDRLRLQQTAYTRRLLLKMGELTLSMLDPAAAEEGSDEDIPVNSSFSSGVATAILDRGLSPEQKIAIVRLGMGGCGLPLTIQLAERAGRLERDAKAANRPSDQVASRTTLPRSPKSRQVVPHEILWVGPTDKGDTPDVRVHSFVEEIDLQKDN